MRTGQEIKLILHDAPDFDLTVYVHGFTDEQAQHLAGILRRGEFDVEITTATTKTEVVHA